ncbi:MAG: hypothetical protein EBR58_05715 [Betaproteobacteria bacterium]|nr:hypothetical protein [Betaproteobacteria bacterium]
MHLYAIDADAGKTGNHSHDASATYASVVDAGATNTRFDRDISSAPYAGTHGPPMPGAAACGLTGESLWPHTLAPCACSAPMKANAAARQRK